jgi:hypothetical protein
MEPSHFAPLPDTDRQPPANPVEVQVLSSAYRFAARSAPNPPPNHDGSPITDKGLATFVRGFDEAHARLAAAIANHQTPPDDVFRPLFETLNWTLPLWTFAKENWRLPGD